LNAVICVHKQLETAILLKQPYFVPFIKQDGISRTWTNKCEIEYEI